MCRCYLRRVSYLPALVAVAGQIFLRVCERPPRRSPRVLRLSWGDSVEQAPKALTAIWGLSDCGARQPTIVFAYRNARGLLDAEGLYLGAAGGCRFTPDLIRRPGQACASMKTDPLAGYSHCLHHERTRLISRTRRYVTALAQAFEQGGARLLQAEVKDFDSQTARSWHRDDPRPVDLLMMSFACQRPFLVQNRLMAKLGLNCPAEKPTRLPGDR